MNKHCIRSDRAVLNAPVSESAVDDPFELLTDEYFYILYMGEIYKDDFYYQDGLGAQSSYKWMTDYDTRELMSAETFLYDDIPIDLTGCAVNGPDSLTSEEQVNFPEKTSIDSDYYYPQGFLEYPDGSEENLGLTRYRVHFLSSGMSLSFLAWVGDNEMTVYGNSPDNGDNVYPTVVQHGDMSSLTYAVESGYIGEIIFVWIFVILVICDIAYSTLQEDDEAPPAANKKSSKKKRK